MMNPKDKAMEQAEEAVREAQREDFLVPVEDFPEVSLTDRLASLAEVARLQEEEGWSVIQGSPYSEGDWPIGDVFAETEATPSGPKLLYNVVLDPDGLRWHHGVMEADDGRMYMAVVPSGVVFSPDFAREWMADRDRKSREASERVEENAREALQRELLRKAANR